MARTSRNNLPVTALDPTEKVYHTALYVRLSVLDGNQKDSDSIENQETLLHNYMEGKPEFVLYSIYTDNGETGVNFERDEFERLIDDVKSGYVNCIIVKDLSRFGRNYLETGEYIGKVFPFLDVRFIAVNDGYDSIDPLADDFAMHLKNLVNDVYARDISKKICPVIRAKQERGEYMGAWAAYGYLKSREDKYKLVVDDETAPIVQDIFTWRFMGLSYRRIIRKLTELAIPSPSKYRFNKGIVKDKRFENSRWCTSTIKSMLSNQVYLGHVVQGRKQQSLFDGQKQNKLPKEEWVIVPNTHEPIIDQETFDTVQQMGERSWEEYQENSGKFKNIGNPKNILKGLVICGNCGARMYRYKNVNVNKNKKSEHHVCYYYVCSRHSKNPSDCSFKSIKETEVLAIVYEVLQQWISMAIDMEKVLKSLKHRTSMLSEEKTVILKMEETKRQINRIQRLRERLYDDYLEQLMSERDYLYAKNRYMKKETALNEHLAELTIEQKRIKTEKPEENPWMKTFLNFRDEPKLIENMAKELIEKVIIYSDSSIRILVRFQEEYEQLKSCLSYLEGVENE